MERTRLRDRAAVCVCECTCPKRIQLDAACGALELVNSTRARAYKRECLLYCDCVCVCARLLCDLCTYGRRRSSSSGFLCQLCQHAHTYTVVGQVCGMRGALRRPRDRFNCHFAIVERDPPFRRAYKRTEKCAFCLFYPPTALRGGLCVTSRCLSDRPVQARALLPGQPPRLFSLCASQSARA